LGYGPETERYGSPGAGLRGTDFNKAKNFMRTAKLEKPHSPYGQVDAVVMC